MDGVDELTALFREMKAHAAAVLLAYIASDICLLFERSDDLGGIGA